MNKTDVARIYRNKFGMDMPTLKLARIIYKDYNLLYKDVEDARLALRRIEGKTNSKVNVTHRHKERSKTPYKLPESFAEKREPFILSGSRDILVISDLHIPYHDNEAINVALNYGVEKKVDTVFINGDLMDFYQLSRFEKNPTKRSVKHEFDATRQFFQYLRSLFPTQEIYYLKGNHDIRYEKWLMTKVYEVFDDEYYHLEQRLNLNEFKVKILDDKVLVKAGKLSITHGHHIMKGFFSPVNSARGAFLKAKQSVLISHVHKVSNHVEVDLDGKVTGTWSTGSLAELKPDYSPLVSNYHHGFAHVLVDKDGDFTVLNRYIDPKGKIH